MRRSIGIAMLVAFALAASGSVRSAPPEGHDHGHGKHQGHDATVRHRFEDAERWAKVFDDPERDTWQKPDVVLDALGVVEGQAVADLGAGTGYFTMRLARRVGEKGKVWAIDIEPNLIDHIGLRAVGAGLTQVETVLARPDDPSIPDAAADLVLIVDTWHHIDARLAYLAKLRRALKKGGRVAIVDFKPGEIPVGPPPEHRLPRAAIEAEFTEAGFSLVADPDVLPYQFVLVFAPVES